MAGKDSEVDAAVLFDQLLLADLQESMSKLNNRVFAEMRSYVEPPDLVLKIIQALLYILNPDGEFETWKQCKQVKQTFVDPLVEVSTCCLVDTLIEVSTCCLH